MNSSVYQDSQVIPWITSVSAPLVFASLLWYKPRGLLRVLLAAESVSHLQLYWR